MGVKYFNKAFGYEKTLRKTGAEIAHYSHQTHCYVNFKGMFGEVKMNLNDFWRPFITVIETWIHHNTPRINENSK